MRISSPGSGSERAYDPGEAGQDRLHRPELRGAREGARERGAGRAADLSQAHDGAARVR